MKIDRFGYRRHDGYNAEDFVLCETCMPDGKLNEAALKTYCKLCGGYGEYPKPLESRPVSKVNWLYFWRK